MTKKSKKESSLQEILKPSTIAPVASKEIAKIEDVGTAMMQTGQEMMLVVEEILIRHHGFTEEKLVQFENQLKEVLSTLGEYERKGFSILNPKDMSTIGEIAEARQARIEAGRAGIQLPSPQETEKFTAKPKKKQLN